MRPRIRTVAFVVGMMVIAAVVIAQDKKDDKPALESGFTALFNGKDLDGWHVMNNGQFSVKEGVIFQNKGNGWLRSEKQYRNFELRMDFRFVLKGSDSGIFLRAGEEGGNWPNVNYQLQTMDNNTICSLFAKGGLKKDKEKKDAEKLKKVMKPTGEWQSYQVVVQGTHFEVRLNGELINTVEGLTDQAGYLGLQGEGGQLEFKNIRVKDM